MNDGGGMPTRKELGNWASAIPPGCPLLRLTMLDLPACAPDGVGPLDPGLDAVSCDAADETASATAVRGAE